MISKKAIGIKIKTLRKDKKITQEKFSEIIDVSTRHMVNIEMGYIYPSIETLEKISMALNVPIQSFFEDDEYNKYYEKNEVIKMKLSEKLEKIS